MVQLISTGSSLQLVIIGTLVSAILYGLLIFVFVQCLILLLSSKKHSYSNRTRRLLVFYVVAMFLFSTVAIIQGFVYIIREMSPGRDQPIYSKFALFQFNEPITLPLTIWGADGFMLRRCIVLYSDKTIKYRTPLYVILFCCGFITFACGIFYYVAPFDTLLVGTSSPPLLATTVAISITAIINCILTALISGRVWYHQESIRRLIGSQFGSPYRRVIVACVESCVLIVITSLAFVVLFALGNRGIEAAIIPLLLLPHVCVLSPLLSIYQVAQGRPAATSQITTGKGGKSIQFHRSLAESIDVTRLSRRYSMDDVESMYK